MNLNEITTLLGDKAEYYLNHESKTVSKDLLHLPGPDFVDRIFSISNRSEKVIENLNRIFNNGRLAKTGYVSILPVDQGIEHSAGASFAPNPIYFGSAESGRQIVEVAQAFERAHELGMATILWCYLRNSDFKKDGVDYHTAADLTAQANHLGVTIQADIIKQKLPTNNGGYNAIKFGKTHKDVYDKLSTDHPIDLTRYQVVNCYMGRAGLINSGGESKGASDLAEAVTTAVINKRAGGMGLISGRKAFQKPMAEGIALLNAIQDVYASKEITVA